MNCPKIEISNSDNSISCVDGCANPWEKIVNNAKSNQVT